MITDGAHSTHIRLSNAELASLADRYVQQHGDTELKLHLVQGCQDVLEPGRRRDKLPWSILKAVQPFIEHSRKRGIDLDSTERLRAEGVLGDMRNGRVDFYAGEQPAATSEVHHPLPPVAHAIMAPLPVPAAPRRPLSPLPASDVRDLTTDLIEINRLVLRLKAADPALLSQASELDAKRIQSLLIQASNGLVFFEEIAALARRL